MSGETKRDKCKDYQDYFYLILGQLNLYTRKKSSLSKIVLGNFGYLPGLSSKSSDTVKFKKKTLFFP